MLTFFAWVCVIYMAAVGSVHLTCPYGAAVLVRVLGFASLVMVTHNIGAVLWDVNT